MTEQRKTTPSFTRKTVKRLDFGIQHTKRPAPSVSAPVPASTPAPISTSASVSAPMPKIRPQAAPKAPSKPLTANHGKFMDFAPSHAKHAPTASESKSAPRPAPRTSSPAPFAATARPVTSAASRPVSSATARPASSRVSFATGKTSKIKASALKASETTRTEAPQVKAPQVKAHQVKTPKTEAPRAEVSSTTMEISSSSPRRSAPHRGLKIDFFRRPVSKIVPLVEKIVPSASVDEPDQEEINSEPEPAQVISVSRTTTRISTPAPSAPRHQVSAHVSPAHRVATDAPFAPGPRRSVRPTPQRDIDSSFASSPSREMTELEEELEALNEFSGDLDVEDSGLDDIDMIEAQIEAAAEAEVDDFVKAPKPLFGEDPLVQMSKAREERESAREAQAAAELKAKTLQQAKKSSYLAPYTLGGRSPFLESVNVEKRPLSAATSSGENILSSGNSQSSRRSSAKSTRTTSAKSSRFGATKSSRFGSSASGRSSSSSAKDSYRSRMKKQLENDAKAIHRQTMMMSTPETKSHKIGLTIAIILTVLLGIGVGAVVYLVFFQ